jgi:tRNA-specific 2-thiouridylase
VKAVGLLSGGLDSTIAIGLVRDQGVEVSAFNLVTAFCCCTPKGASCSAARTAVRQLGIDLKVVNATDEFLPIVANPKHGYGSGMNPCIDCRILMFRKAREYMEEIGGSFVVTGEVLGQRPMSQRRDVMRLIERRSGLEGYIVRPLSAGVLEPSVPEREGWVDRSRFLSITGRSRKGQMAVAEELGVRDYPCPAGGCLLTDRVFAARVRDLLEHEGRLLPDDVRLLKTGRHFRLGPHTKAVVGRDETENSELERQVLASDAVLEVDGAAGPFTIVRGDPSATSLELAAAITARYSRLRDRGQAAVILRWGRMDPSERYVVAPARGDLVATMRVGGT